MMELLLSIYSFGGLLWALFWLVLMVAQKRMIEDLDERIFRFRMINKKTSHTDKVRAEAVSGYKVQRLAVLLTPVWPLPLCAIVMKLVADLFKTPKENEA